MKAMFRTAVLAVLLLGGAQAFAAQSAATSAPAAKPAPAAQAKPATKPAAAAPAAKATAAKPVQCRDDKGKFVKCPAAPAKKTCRMVGMASR